MYMVTRDDLGTERKNKASEERLGDFEHRTVQGRTSTTRLASKPMSKLLCSTREVNQDCDSVKMSPLPAVGSGGEYKKKKTEDRTSTVSLVKHARLVGKLRSAKQRVVNLEQELQIERMLSRRLQKQLLALL
ncbi:hypothetical protein HPB47_013819, partial [Ixodes persulcatus]